VLVRALPCRPPPAGRLNAEDDINLSELKGITMPGSPPLRHSPQIVGQRCTKHPYIHTHARDLTIHSINGL